MDKNKYKLAIAMYEQYQKDVAKVGVELNLPQIKTFLLLQKNIEYNYPVKLSWKQKIIGAFKNRKK